MADNGLDVGVRCTLLYLYVKLWEQMMIYCLRCALSALVELLDYQIVSEYEGLLVIFDLFPTNLLKSSGYNMVRGI